MNRGKSHGASQVILKPTQSRRAWSTKEEEVLIVAIKDLLGKGWKSDNGFRAGYLSKLETKVMEALPGTDLRALPHIHSKMTNWKRTFSSLSTALARSGVGYNEITNMIDCDDETWDLIVKADKNADTLRYKSFPLFPFWTEIYGKDRANGQRAVDVLDAFNNLMRDELAADVSINDDEDDPNVDGNGDNIDGNSVCGGDLQQESSKPTSKRRKVAADTDAESLHELMVSIAASTNELQSVTRYFGYEHGIGQKRETIFNLLKTVDGLTDLDRYDLADVLGKDSDRLEVFNGLPDEHKLPYLTRLMERLGLRGL